MDSKRFHSKAFTVKHLNKLIKGTGKLQIGRDGPHCRTWNPQGGVGSRSNSSHLTLPKPTQLHPLIP